MTLCSNLGRMVHQLDFLLLKMLNPGMQVINQKGNMMQARTALGYKF